jgi:glycosyltransferase involved in cell wall biosynthesis
VTEIPFVEAATISVVIPAFNAAPFLALALESALAEMPALAPGKDFEILVVDDCSTDATPDIAAGYAGRGVRCLRRSIQGGIGAARNTGVAAAEGELLAFLDADDLWPPARLAPLRAALDLAGPRGMAFGHIRQFACPSMNPDMRGRLRVPTEPIPGYCASAMLLRRRDFLSVGAFSETLKVAEFIDWFGRARDSGLVSRLIDQVVLERRIHGANQTIRHRADYSDYALTLKRGLDRRRSGNAS